MGKFRKAAPGGRKGGTGKRGSGAKAGARKASSGTGRGRGKSSSFIPERGKSPAARPYKRKDDAERPKRREYDDKPSRSREGDNPDRRGPASRPFARRSDSDKPFKRASGDKPFRSREGDREEKSGSERGLKARPFQRSEESGSSRKRTFDDKPVRSRDSERPERSRRDDDAPTRPYKRREDSDSPVRKSYSKDAGTKRPYERRDDSDRTERRSYSKEPRTTSREDRPAPSRSGERSSRPYQRRESTVKPRKGRSEGKFFRPDEDNTTEKRKRIGQDDHYKRPEPSRYGDSPREGEERKWNRKESHELYGDKNKSKTPFPKKDKAESFSSDGEDGTRLNKFIANAGICSRREADEMIKVGVISVNGEIITEMGYKVQSGDVVKYNNETLRGERLVYILLNKPKDFITTTDDPEERKTVMNLIAKACKERVYPVGRLDRNTTGVLLFTNDGDIAKKLTHPSFEIQKIYQVELDQALKKADMEAVQEGLTLSDGFIKVDEIAYANEARNVIGVEIHSGRNRIVRRIFEYLDYSVKKLDRVVFAGLTKKDLPRGRWRFLTEMEIANLKMITGKKKKVS